ncbi:hypothetical protein DFQ14_12222 [Halopolyspora algeriensis]|uniref:Uncharacterized protein n=1 Tax=Halopolyspora algeriensis TaxID=1500506 RepID=A0A368VBD2_9ACTN|nr:hypothetical protein [Halopolyspora algeriensis]RCW38479.1 hypothetical protein DFQ14_12222 [Halopolyspora algeriensis]TQM42640.1 hypothetical protein FHU43_4279 [Halopolyspora algeriensis]
MSRKQWGDRTCTECGHPSGRRRYCGPCDPTRAGREHRDKYAQEARS